MTKAVVCDEVGARLRVDDLQLGAPKSGEVRISVAASAVCHSDLLVHDGTLRSPFPMVLGHEAVGTVMELGEGVTGMAVGDHVVVSTMPQCGECEACRNDERHLCQRVAGPMAEGSLPDGTFRWSREDGTPVRQQAGVGAFAAEIVISALSAVPISPEIPFRSAAMAGCRLITGMGAALNTADIQRGDTVAVIGCGGVGLSVIQAARIAGASEIIAIDLRPDKLELARSVGATTTLAGDVDGLVRTIRGSTARRGVDIAFDIVGVAATFDQALSITRRGGQVILVGVPAPDVVYEIRGYAGILAASKTIKGAWLGWSNVARDIPRFLSYYQSGELQLDELVTAYPVEQINEAFAAVRGGAVACAVIEYA